MKIQAIIFLFLSGAAWAAPVADTMPSDVEEFVDERDLCDHFRGEDPYDAERRAFLETNMAALCAGTDARLSSLKEKYQGNQAVLGRLAEYEEDIEPDR